MRRNGRNAFCCGGGGGNFFTDILGTARRQRLPRARPGSAGDRRRIIAVACPNCAKMLTDAVKMENLEDSLEVLGIAEILAKAKK